VDFSTEERRRAFNWWLRTGRWPARTTAGIELKFNPYHDPRNGQFTFAPGGFSGQHDQGQAGGRMRRDGASRPSPLSHILPKSPATERAQFGAASPEPPMGRGSNSRAFDDPMTLERAFPGLEHAPGGAIVAVADNILDLRGPADAAVSELAKNWSNQVMAQIKAIDPNWHYDKLGPIETLQGQINELNDLRFRRAAAFLRVKGDPGPLQVETLRFVQQRTDEAYSRGKALLKAGRLDVRLSEQEALGNYIDREVRGELRERYNQLDIDWAGQGSVRVNRREYDSSGADLTYRRPDARVGEVAFDVTLSRKTLGTAQIRGFFNTDFQPSRVVIIRPSQLGTGHTYAIPRPGTKR
jgi:hypothetical protein